MAEGEALLRPLAGIVVLDLSRMLPGAVLARQLLDLGARLIKVEDPRGGDPMRGAPPLVAGTGAGYRTLLRGAESVCLDLRTEAGQATVRALAARADVLVESFRPGTMARWGVGPADLATLNPRLVSVSLSAFGAGDPRVAHDLDVVAASGLFTLLTGGREGVQPRVQVADVTAALLAGSAVLAALLGRHRTGRGRHLDQPLATGALPFLAWAAADHQAGAPGQSQTLLAGEAAGYAVYACQDGARLAVATIEPKFWATFCEVLGLALPLEAGLATGAAGANVRAQVAARLADRPRDAWLAALAGLDLPIGPVDGLEAAAPADTPWLPAWPAQPGASAPALGADTARVLAEFGGNAPA